MLELKKTNVRRWDMNKKFICILASTTAYVAVELITMGFVKEGLIFASLFIFAMFQLKQQKI